MLRVHPDGPPRGRSGCGTPSWTPRIGIKVRDGRGISKAEGPGNPNGGPPGGRPLDEPLPPGGGDHSGRRHDSSVTGRVSLAAGTEPRARWLRLHRLPAYAPWLWVVFRTQWGRFPRLGADPASALDNRSRTVRAVGVGDGVITLGSVLFSGATNVPGIRRKDWGLRPTGRI